MASILYIEKKENKIKACAHEIGPPFWVPSGPWRPVSFILGPHKDLAKWELWLSSPKSQNWVKLHKDRYTTWPYYFKEPWNERVTNCSLSLRLGGGWGQAMWMMPEGNLAPCPLWRAGLKVSGITLQRAHQQEAGWEMRAPLARVMERQGSPGPVTFLSQDGWEQRLSVLCHVRELREQSTCDLGREFRAIQYEN